MAQPRAYTRQANFTGHSTSQPSTPHSGTSLDAEFDAIKLTTDETRTNLALIQRDDGKLANATVHPDAFTTASLAMMAGSWTPRGEWATSILYAASDVVAVDDVAYVSTVAHVSGVFATDLAAGKWIGFSRSVSSAIAFTPYGNIQSETVQDAIKELEDEKEPAFTSASSKTATATGTTAARTLAARFSDCEINVKDCGGVGTASLVDGSGTSDAAALQAAITAAEARDAEERIPTVLLPPGVFLIDASVVATKRIRIRGTGKYQSILLIRLSSRDGTTPGLDLQAGAVLENVGFRGYVTGDTNWFLADSVGIKASNVIEAFNCDFFGFEKGITYGGGFYHKFVDCVFQRSKTVFPGWNANNISFVACRATIFDTFFEYNGGAGPISAFGCSFESWCVRLFSAVSGARAAITLSGCYIENYPASTAGKGLADANFDSGFGLVGSRSVTLLGCMISLKGIVRLVDNSGSALDALISKGNRLIAFNSSPNDTCTHVFLAGSFKTVDVSDYFDGTFIGTAYISGTYTYPDACRVIDPATFADASPKEDWIDATLVNDWVNDGGSGYANAGYRKAHGYVELRGLVDGGASTDEVIFTLPAEYRPTTYKLFPINDLRGGYRATVRINGPAGTNPGDVTVMDFRTITGAADNGSGLIRLTIAAGHRFVTGDTVRVRGVTGTTEANGTWVATAITSTTIDLQGSTFANAYAGGGEAIFEYNNLPLDSIRFSLD